MSNFEVLMPSMGEGITEATLVKWLKKPGDKINKEEPLLEVSTDKVDTEIPSPASGYLVAVFGDEGGTIQVNAVIAHIGGELGAAAAAPKAAPAKQAPSTLAASGAVSAPQKSENQAPALQSGASAADAVAAGDAVPVANGLRSSPLVRKIAKDTGVDLNQVQGTGLHGRITKRDIEAFQAGGGAPTVTARATTSATSTPTAGRPAGAPYRAGDVEGVHTEWGRVETKVVNGAEVLDGVAVRREKMSKMRSLIAEHMVRSVRTSPHVTTVFEIDLHRVVKLREKVKDSFAKQEGFNLTYTHFFIQAAVHAIKKHPIVNVSVDGNDILWKDSINVGCAVAIESGLIVPVIKNAGELNLLGIARRMNDLVVRARSKKLLAEDAQGGTFTITNPGMFGSIVSAPIINQPQVAIMSIGAIVKRPVVIDDMIAVRPLVQIGLTFDHRVIDGEGGAKWLAALKEFLENYSDPGL